MPDVIAEAQAATHLLEAWTQGDFDGFAESLEAIADPGQDLIDELERSEGDARASQGFIEAELLRLAGLIRGSLYLIRRAIDIILDPPAERFGSRAEVIERLLYDPS